MRKTTLTGLILGVMIWLPSAAQAGMVIAKIDKSTQTMRVYVDGNLRHSWKVSTGRRGYNTPTGQWRPKYLKRMHYSRKYNNSPMPYSIFYKGGYAIHGTNVLKRLGRRASHGCIRLHPANAKKLFSLVRRHGKASTRIIVSNSFSMIKKSVKTPAKRKVWRARTTTGKKVNHAKSKPVRRVKLSGDLPRDGLLMEAQEIIRGSLL